MSKFIVFGIKKPEDARQDDLQGAKSESLRSIGGVVYQPATGKKSKPAITTNRIQPGKPVDNKPKEK